MELQVSCGYQPSYALCRLDHLWTALWSRRKQVSTLPLTDLACILTRSLYHDFECDGKSMICFSRLGLLCFQRCQNSGFLAAGLCLPVYWLAGTDWLHSSFQALPDGLRSKG